jgi:DNA repair exonuclease SbcCD ATPase subunit
MWRAFWLILIVFGMPAATFSQAASSDSQTIQALLTEVRELRQDLRTSLARVQNTQILLSRLQTQQEAVTRASERLRDARSKVADEQGHQKHIASVTKRFEDALSAEESPAKQKELRDVINHNKSELEDSTNEEQQRQATEIEAEQQLRTEQDKLTMIENQLDELVRNLSNSGEQSSRVPH